MVLTAAPQDSKGHLLRGRSLLVEMAFEEGTRELPTTLELDPGNEQIYFELARSYSAIKQPQEAEAIIEKGLQLNRSSRALILAKGDVLLAQGKRAEAEA